MWLSTSSLGGKPPISTAPVGLSSWIILLAAPLAACTGPSDPLPVDDSALPAACVEETPETAEKDTGAAPRAARAMSGAIDLHVDFDADAESLGLYDCDYRREYTNFEERTDLGWLCPTCTLLTQGRAVVTEGYDDCYVQISDADAERTEQLGLIEGDEIVLLGSKQNLVLTEAGPLVDGAATWSSDGELDGGTYVLTSVASVQIGEGTGTVDDPTGARTEPYACGWPTESPGGAVSTYTFELGSLFPDAKLLDACEERVALWDFRGRYLVIDASSPNCGPCQAMAERSEAFKTHMAELCVDVEMVTLLNAGLSAVNVPADPLTLRSWTTTFGLTSAVLADEGFGYGVIAPVLSPDGGMGLPSIVVLDPEGRVIYMDTGFGETSGWFQPIEDVIVGG